MKPTHYLLRLCLVLPAFLFTLTRTAAQCPEVVVTLPADSLFCKNTTLTLGTIEQFDYTFLWSTGDTSATIIISIPGLYSVTVTNACGNLAADTVQIQEIEAPDVAIEGIGPICPGDTVVLLATGSDVVETYQWSTGDTISQTLVTAAGMYFLTVTNACGENFYDIRIPEATECPALIPTAFSPDNDGTNDTFGPLGGGFTVLTFRVFDRWGEIVFESAGSIIPRWDGTVNGNPAPMDVYIWQLTRRFINDESPVTEHGEVTLLR